jgi:hypothetical protein
MSHSDYRTLINRGRKSGLKTSELYSALASQPPVAGDLVNGGTDGNGFAPVFDPNGHAIFKPQENPQSSK